MADGYDQIDYEEDLAREARLKEERKKMAKLDERRTASWEGRVSKATLEKILKGVPSHADLEFWAVTPKDAVQGDDVGVFMVTATWQTEIRPVDFADPTD